MKGSHFQSAEKNRYLAAEAVHAVVYKKQSLSHWTNSKKQLDLTPKTNKFIHSYLLGSLRWFIQNKTILAGLLSSPIKKKDKIVETLLCCAIYEITRMRTPNYAVVSSTVEAAKVAQKNHLAALINATLRNFIRKKREFITKARQTPEGRYSFPLWFIEQTKKNYAKFYRQTVVITRYSFALYICLGKLIIEEWEKNNEL